MIDYNLHTHSFYCGHGHGTIREYFDKANSIGLKTLGFSEHLPLPDKRHQRSRMKNEQMVDYEADVRALSSASVFLGYEADYYKEYNEYVRTIFDRVDYLTFGVHFIETDEGIKTPFTDTFTLQEAKQYFSQFKDAVESDLFTFAAHPDLFLSAYRKWDAEAKAISRDIITLALEHELPLEINGNGILKAIENKREGYPFPVFWQMAKEMGAVIIPGFDAHEVINLERSKQLLEAFCKENNFIVAPFEQIKFRKDRSR